MIRLSTQILKMKLHQEWKISILNRIANTIGFGLEGEELWAILVAEHADLVYYLQIDIQKTILRVFPSIFEYFFIRTVGSWCIQRQSHINEDLIFFPALAETIKYYSQIIDKILIRLRPALMITVYDELENTLWEAKYREA